MEMERDLTCIRFTIHIGAFCRISVVCDRMTRVPRRAIGGIGALLYFTSTRVLFNVPLDAHEMGNKSSILNRIFRYNEIGNIYIYIRQVEHEIHEDLGRYLSEKWINPRQRLARGAVDVGLPFYLISYR